jgi:hypothetical protein
MKSKTLWLTLLAALIGIPVAVAMAAAGKPIKGAIYQEKNVQLRFAVSANGKSVTQFQGPFVAACANPAEANPKWQKHAKISGGKFTIKEIVPAHSKNSYVLTGRFTGHGGVTGKIRVATQCLRPPNFNSGPVKHKTFSFSASAEPDGSDSRYCEDKQRHVAGIGFFYFTNLTEKGTNCSAVEHAIKAGKVTTFLPPQTPAPPEFSTTGWTCTRATTSGIYTCQRGKADFSFINAL